MKHTRDQKKKKQQSIHPLTMQRCAKCSMFINVAKSLAGVFMMEDESKAVVKDVILIHSWEMIYFLSKQEKQK